WGWSTYGRHSSRSSPSQPTGRLWTWRREPRLRNSMPHLRRSNRWRTAPRAAPLLSVRTAARVYVSLTANLYFFARYLEAIPLAEHAVAHAQAAGDRSLLAHAWAFLGILQMLVGRLPQAVTALEAARDVGAETQNFDALFLANGSLGTLYELQGAFDR